MPREARGAAGNDKNIGGKAAPAAFSLILPAKRAAGRGHTGKDMDSIAVFASGEGTNAENIIRHFQNSGTARVTLLAYSRREAPVRLRAARLGVRAAYLPKSALDDSGQTLPLLREAGASVIALAGFLPIIPGYLLEAYRDRIINIHPSLLPLHGGKGMHGIHVHEDVLACGDKETGITVHLADGELDHGRALFQAKCPVERGDTAEDIAARVRKLELAFYPEVIERFCQGRY